MKSEIINNIDEKFILYTADSTTALPLQEFLKNAFFCPSIRKKGSRVCALYGLFQLSDKEHLFTLCKAITNVTCKPVFLSFPNEKYKITMSEISEISKISGPVPKRTRDTPGLIMNKFYSNHGAVWNIIVTHKERAIIHWMKYYQQRISEDSDLYRAIEKVLQRYQRRTNQVSDDRPAGAVIDFFVQNYLCLCLWAYDKTLTSEQNYSRTEGIKRILSEAGHRGFVLSCENKPESTFIFTSSSSKDMQLFRAFTVSCAAATNQIAGLYKASDNRIYKITVTDPAANTLLSKSLPINEEQLNNILKAVYGEDCVLPEKATIEDITPLEGIKAIERRACLIQSINKYGINAIADILNKSSSGNTNGKLK